MLRASAALLLASAAARLVALPPWADFGLIVLATALVLGALTRFAAAVCVILAAIGWFRISGDLGLIVALHGLDASALALLGAGAYSIDARLFGRRVVALDLSGAAWRHGRSGAPRTSWPPISTHR